MICGSCLLAVKSISNVTLCSTRQRSWYSVVFPHYVPLVAYNAYIPEGHVPERKITLLITNSIPSDLGSPQMGVNMQIYSVVLFLKQQPVLQQKYILAVIFKASCSGLSSLQDIMSKCQKAVIWSPYVKHGWVPARQSVIFSVLADHAERSGTREAGSVHFALELLVLISESFFYWWFERLWTLAQLFCL